MPELAFEPMSIGQILDRTFKIYKENFVRFVAIVAIVQVPIALLTIVATTLVMGGGSPKGFSFGVIAVGLVGVFFAVLSQVLCNGALTRSVSAAYLGQEISIGKAYATILPKLATLIAAGIAVGLIVVLGLCLLIVPGIIFGLWFALTTQSIIVENTTATDGMKRSKALASGNLGKVFGVQLVIMLISFVISIVFNTVGGVLSAPLAVVASTAAGIVRQLFSVAAQVIAMPIISAAPILLYYDLRIRKEGFDLEMLAKSLAPAEAPANASRPRE